MRQKSRCSHQEATANCPGDFVSRFYLNASTKTSDLSQATVHLLAGWQIIAFTTTIPNAATM
jgi:hypothetical protein